MIDPPRWSPAELTEGIEQAVGVFRRERLAEPAEVYAGAFDQYRGQIERLFDVTSDLVDLHGAADRIVNSDGLLEAFRYLGGPPGRVDRTNENRLTLPLANHRPARCGR